MVCANTLIDTSVKASNDPLVYSYNFNYLGAFRVPNGLIGTDQFSYGGQSIAYNPINNSLFVTGHKYHVAEISIPTPIIATNLTSLNTAKVLQNFSDVTEGNMKKIAANGEEISGEVKIGGLLVYGNKLIGTSYETYGTSAVLSHFASGLNLSTTGDFAGMYAVGSSPSVPTASFVDGYMTKVPANLQTKLGGPALTGHGIISIMSRTSFGPAAFSFDPSKLGIDTPVAATPLLYYPMSHSTLNPPIGTGEGGASASQFFTQATMISGMTMVNGSRSVLFFGTHGIGNYGYGAPTIIPEYDGLNPCPGSETLCMYDPFGKGKGPHAYPYIYQVWAYDSNDLEEVKNGTKKPWDVMPYAIWTLPLTAVSSYVYPGAATYDPVTQRLYIVTPDSDKIASSSSLPVIHVFSVDLLAKSKSSYKLKGKVMLLNGTVVLKNNGADDLTISASDRTAMQDFSFTTPIAPGGAYNVTVAKQPDNLFCTVLNGKGIVNANADITNIVLTCSSEPKAPHNVKGSFVK